MSHCRQWKEAVEAFRAASESASGYDLVCMDILLPEMDGQAAVKEMRSWERERAILSTGGAKIIMTTAVDAMKDVIRSFQELCDAYLVKPVNLGDLFNHLKGFGLV